MRWNGIRHRKCMECQRMHDTVMNGTRGEEVLRKWRKSISHAHSRTWMQHHSQVNATSFSRACNILLTLRWFNISDMRAKIGGMFNAAAWAHKTKRITRTLFQFVFVTSWPYPQSVVPEKAIPQAVRAWTTFAKHRGRGTWRKKTPTAQTCGVKIKERRLALLEETILEVRMERNRIYPACHGVRPTRAHGASNFKTFVSGWNGGSCKVLYQYLSSREWRKSWARTGDHPGNDDTGSICNVANKPIRHECAEAHTHHAFLVLHSPLGHV